MYNKRMCIKAVEVHWVIEFQHSNWMNPYIMLSSRLRRAAKDEPEKDFLKLMKNSGFGKTMENIRHHKRAKKTCFF